MPELHPKQFMKQFHPGEYSHKWRSVASNSEFLKNVPMAELIEDVGSTGIQKPVTVYKDIVVDGHHRVIAGAVTGSSIPYEETTDAERYHNQYRVATRARASGDMWMMPSSAPVSKKAVPPRLREFLGWSKS